MAKNRTMAAKNAKARRLSMMESKKSVTRTAHYEYMNGFGQDEMVKNLAYKPDYSARPRKIPVVSYCAQNISPTCIMEIK